VAFTVPTASDFKTYFTRDFPFGTTQNTVLDSDITKAIVEAGFNINTAFFGTQEQYSVGYLYLTAHYLVMDLRASAQGIAGNFPWLTASKSVGSVAETFMTPEALAKSPTLAHLGKTYYGAKYLSLVYPRLVGNVFASFGGTQA
jgi:hypothetical protein